MKRINWTKEETILAFELYCRTSFGRMHQRNPEVIALSKAINRTPGSVALKLCNFAALDPSLPQKGASHGSRMDQVVWNDFSTQLDKLIEVAEEIKLGLNLPPLPEETIELPTEQAETDKFSTVKIRIGQRFFRAIILSTYDSKCCLTGISFPEMLVASHIVPWSKDKTQRLNPRNGLCLNVMHDKAFDTGLISFDDDYQVILSKKLKGAPEKSGFDFLLRTEGTKIRLPKRFLPDKSFLRCHRQFNKFE